MAISTDHISIVEVFVQFSKITLVSQQHICIVCVLTRYSRSVLNGLLELLPPPPCEPSVL